MGADFIEKATPTFKKSWDRERLQLATADLFTRLPTSNTRSFAAHISGESALSKGDKLTVEKIRGALVLTRGHTEIARSDNPPLELVQAVEARCGIAQGTVDEVYDAAGVADISLC